MRGRHLAPSVRRIARGWVVPLALSFSLVMSSIAFASSVDVAVVDVTVPVGSVTLAPGASGAIMVRATVSGNQIGTATFKVYRDWTLSGGVFTGSSPETFTAGPQAGGATQVFEVAGTVTVASGQAAGAFILGASAFDITNSNTTGAKLTDGADSSYSVTVLAPPADTTPPMIVPTVTGTLGSNGWFVSNAGVTWAVTDAESTVTSTSGCGGVSLTTDTAGITYTCSATSTGGTASQSVTIKRDATAPSVSGSANPAANGAGWNDTDVTVSFSCSDALSGVASCGSNATLSGEGAGQSATGTATDNAGNSASTTVSNINIDKTAPTITGSRSPAANGAGWNNTDVSVTFSCSDVLSGLASCGPDESVSGEGAGQSRTGTAVDLAGNSASDTVSGISIDKTDPSISGSITGGTLGSNGWYTSNVIVTFDCSDVLSGIDSCTVPQTLSSDGAGQSASGTAVDRASNSASDTVSGIDIDATAPTITGTRSPAANGYGWNNGRVDVTFSCFDATSGYETCGPDTSLSGEGAGQSATGIAVDYAGNSASDTVAGINIDLTGPTITGTRSPAANGYGWNNTNVTVSFSCADALSGVASCGPNATVSGEGVGQSRTGTAVDKAGNSASDTVLGISIDKTAPTAVVTGVTSGATYTLGAVPAVGCSTTDDRSGVATEASYSVSGGPLVGAFTATCSGAIDKAGNVAADASVSYTVHFAWSGFFQPIDNPGVNAPYVFNRAKAGSSIPVKFSLAGNYGLGILAAGFPQSNATSCSAAGTMDTVETVTAGNSGLSYDALMDQYVYVWKTDKSWAGTCRKLTVRLTDGTDHIAYFNFTR